jgi:hypothetical protein
MLDFVTMLSLNDERWTQIDGGYRMSFDPRLLLSRLESDPDTAAVWHELWDELHHQGDVGEASFAAVPHLVRICRSRGELDWNVYALTAIIELARKQGSNPDVPQWLSTGYFRAIRELAETGSREILTATDPDTARAILSILAIERHLPTHARFLINYSEDELLEME